MQHDREEILSLNVGQLFTRHWEKIFLLTVIATALAGGYSFYAPEQFQSATEILLMKKDAGLTTTSGATSSDVQEDVMEDVLATHMRLLTSRRVIDHAIESHELAELPGIEAELDEDTTITEYIEEQLSAGRGGEGASQNAQVISATFTHTDAEETEKVLSSIVASYNDFLKETFTNVSSEAITLIENASQQLGEDLEAEQAKYAEFRKNAPLLFAEESGVSLNAQRVVGLEQRRADLNLERSMLISRLRLLNDSMSGPGASGFTDRDRLALIDDQHIGRLTLLLSVERGDAVSEAFVAEQPVRQEVANVEYEKLVSLRTEAAQLTERLGPTHPRVQEIRAAISELTGFLSEKSPNSTFDVSEIDPSDVVQTYVRLLENDIIHIDRQLAAIDENADALMSKAKESEAYELENALFTERIRRKEEIYDAVVQRLRDVNLVTSYGGYVTEQIAPVGRAEVVWPRPVLLLALGSMVGFVLGLGGAIYAELSDRTFESADQVSSAMATSLLGVFGHFDYRVGRDEIEEAGVASHLAGVHRPRSRESEAIRGVRTSLFFASHASSAQVLQITSPTPGDGKSLLAGNLAVSLAMAEKSVLLIDADMRLPTQHKSFLHSQQPGLADVLIDAAELSDAIEPTQVERLDILPSGTLPPNPAELLATDRFANLLDTLRQRYDFVIVDSPPILAVSDPLCIAPSVDGVVLVVPVLKNHAPAALEAREMLGAIDAKLLGVVVNDRQRRLSVAQSKGYGKGGGYGYSYGYEYGSGDDTNSGYVTSARAKI